ncbi:MAG: arabinosyltransferase domain-containing protein [Pseudonocardiales bacterium]|nr:arabinosyltransferase domain-containing protein [Pseudonocardiales bacterium]
MVLLGGVGGQSEQGTGSDLGHRRTTLRQVPVPETTRALSPRARRLDDTALQDGVAGRSVAPVTPRSPSTATRRATVLAVLAVLTLTAAIGASLAPVVADDPVVRWPQAGQPPRSTVLPLVPYRPLRLDARVPCTALSALDQRAEGGDALRTLPVTAGREGRVSQGLVVAVHSGVVQVSASGRTLVRELLPADPCTYRVLADAGGVRVLRSPGAGVPHEPGAGGPQEPGAGIPQEAIKRASASVPVPQVNELVTDVEGQPAAQGLAVTLHPDSRYESTPTALKIVLLGICAAALLVLLGLAWRWWGGDKLPGRRPRLRGADAVLVIVSGAWVLLGPTNFDDPWYELMARGANASGSVGNAIYMFNVTENPFVASQYVLQAWGALGGWGLAWMRLVPLIYGLVTWVLLRLLLAPFDLESPRAAWALLVAFLLWWLPYGMTLRPEPLIVLLAAATLLLTELARRRYSVGVLGAAATTAVLAMSVSPSGLVAVAPLVLALPWLGVWWRARPAVDRLAAVLLGAATATSLVLVGCADATLADVLEATAVHKWYYQSFPWYRELVHYQTILSFQDSSQWARRAPVVLTIAVLLVVAMAAVRRLLTGAVDNDHDPARRLLISSAACSALALALLAPTPTKFVNHFGAAAAAPTVLLTAALLRAPRRLPLRPRRADIVTAAAATALLVGAVSWSFAGPNIWRPYSDRGQPFGNHLTLAQDRPDLVSVRPRLGPVQLANPLLWVAVAAAASYAMWWWRRRSLDRGPAPDRAVLVAGSTAIVVMTIVVFGWAPVRQYPGWSVALSAVRSARGEPCALSDYAQIAVDTPAQPVPVGTPTTTGSFATAARQPAPVPPPAAGTLVWHNAVGYDTERDLDSGALTRPAGWLVTPWFTLPVTGGSTLLLPVLGAAAGQRLALQYATAAGPDPAVSGELALQVDRAVPRTEWNELPVALDRLGKARPSSVRLVMWTQTASADSWLAVGQPRLAGWRPMSTLTNGRPVYVDQLTAALLPCLDQVGVEHGIARAPQVLVLSDEGFGRGFLDLGFEVWRGGTQVPVSRSATTVRIPSRLMPSGPPTLPWGRVERVIYDHPVGLVDVHVTQLRQAGWARHPTLAAKNYHGDPG